MRPRLTILSDAMVQQIITEAIELLQDPGVRVHNEDALTLLAAAGATIDHEKRVARIPEKVVRAALETAPREFRLYDLNGHPAVHYGGDSVQFDPGSAALAILDSRRSMRRAPQ